MNPLNDFALFWNNYANFKGRTPRRGYWFVQLWLCVIYFLLFIIFVASDLSAIVAVLTSVFSLAILIPSLSLTVRRLHDTGRHWYWILFPYIPAAVSVVVTLLILASAGGVTSVASLGVLSSGILFATVVLGILNFVFGIIWIVIMASPTSPDAFGVSTHDKNTGASYGPGVQMPAYAEGAAGAQVETPGVATIQDAGLEASPYYQKGSITGISGMYSGIAFPISPGETMTLGRDSALCHIVIDHGAAKVSRKHVSLVYDPKKKLYHAHDYSSNGTFRDDGTRLAVDTDVALPAGTVISLGSASNSFKLG
ncbi:MAG: DUF805 domain-containing protein [Coriobacteriales bacterium]|jgi:uncharacterized membrane protein YhaH (DUF805 family)|nr:DUF805 domain-containing protein [Coriobacteriales bacterium]